MFSICEFVNSLTVKLKIEKNRKQDLQHYQDEQKQERRQDKCSEGVRDHSWRLLLWFPEQVLQKQDEIFN